MDTTNEQWKDVPGYDGDYIVSNLGRVKSFKWGIEQVKHCAPNDAGYPVASLYRNNRLKRHRVHILVAELFVGHQPSPIHQVNHIDRNRGNPIWTNLEWVTPAGNSEHSIEFMSRGERHATAKLTDRQVDEIRKRALAGESQTSLARAFGIAQSHVWKLVRGKQRNGIRGGGGFDVGPRPPIGERHSRAKLKNADIPVIRALFDQGLTNVAIAARYGLSSGTVSQIRCRRIWRMIP